MMLRSWVETTLPPIFSRKLVLQLELWQLICLPILLLLAYVGSRFVTALFMRISLRLSRLTVAKWDDLLFENLRAPIRLFFTALLNLALLPFLDLPPPVLGKLAALVHIALILSAFWGLLRSADVVHQSMRASLWVKERPSTLPVLLLTNRFVKIGIVMLALVTVLQQIGYPIAGLIAGLGVGGLAVALAAQKTLENLLGSVMLTIDQPMRPGDLITVDGTTGTVESIGLRSTQIRTSARTIVTIPNGKLADSKIENLAPRERLQLTFSLGLSYDASPAQLTGIMNELRAFIMARDDSFKDGVFVHLRELGESALVIEVTCWFFLAEGVDFRDVKQAVLMEALTIVERSGTHLAYPTRQLIMSRDKSA